MTAHDELHDMKVLSRLRDESWVSVCRRAGIGRDRAGRLARGERHVREVELAALRRVLGVETASGATA
jgi:hypothetical protein